MRTAGRRKQRRIPRKDGGKSREVTESEQSSRASSPGSRVASSPSSRTYVDQDGLLTVSPKPEGNGEGDWTEPGVQEEGEEGALGEAGDTEAPADEDTGVGLGLPSELPHGRTEQERAAERARQILDARVRVEERRQLKEEQEQADAKVKKARRRRKRREKKEKRGESDDSEGQPGSETSEEESYEESSSEDDNPFEFCYENGPSRRKDGPSNNHRPDIRGYENAESFAGQNNIHGYQNSEAHRPERGAPRVGGNIWSDWAPNANVEGGVEAVGSCWSGVMTQLCGTTAPWISSTINSTINSLPLVGVFTYDPVPDQD